LGRRLERGRQPGAKPRAHPALRISRRKLGHGDDGARARCGRLDPDLALCRARPGSAAQLARRAGRGDHGRCHLSAEHVRWIQSRDPDRRRSGRLLRIRAGPARPQPRGDRLGATRPGAGALTSSKPLYLKPRGAAALVPWEEIAVDAPEVSGQTPLEAAQFVALDIETTGNAPFLVLEIGAERFHLSGPLSFFDTLVDCRAPINPYARKRHHIDRSMLIGAPEFKDARRAFLRFALRAVLVEHSHDAFDPRLVGRRLQSPPDQPSADRAARKIVSTSSVGLVRLTWRLTSLKSGSFSFT